VYFLKTRLTINISQEILLVFCLSEKKKKKPAHSSLTIFIIDDNILFFVQSDGCLSSSGGIRPQLQNWRQKASRIKKAEFIRTAEKFKNQ
jgi:hypothetical protein